MDKKTFHSRLFKRKITPDNPDFWIFLHAEILHRLKQLEDLNCKCNYCARDKSNLKRILDYAINDGHIEENPKPRNFAGIGYCERIQEEQRKNERGY